MWFNKTCPLCGCTREGVCPYTDSDHTHISIMVTLALLILVVVLVLYAFPSYGAQGLEESRLYVEKFLPYKQLIITEIDDQWPTLPIKSVVPSQIEQETCYSARHKKCWSPYSELKTSREYGFGLGQITVTTRFNNFLEAKKLDASLSDWKWENRYNSQYQIRTLLLMDRFNYGKFNWADNEHERIAFTIAAYNGGIGGVLSDRKVCIATTGCNPNVWFDEVEHTSRKAKTPSRGYGKSFFEINREYVRNIMCIRHYKYSSHLEEIAPTILGCLQ